MLKRFLRIRNELFETAETDGVPLDMGTSIRAKYRIERFDEIIHKIYLVNCEIQRNGASISFCREKLDALIETVESQKDNILSPFHRCALGTESLTYLQTLLHIHHLSPTF